MSFWTYMLHCHGGQFYVGHTDDLERRDAQHEAGALAGFTRDHLPVKLVWSEEFGTRQEAKEAEKRLKGWGQSKKLALIRGDWALIAALAKGKNGPSTSSGQRILAGTYSTTRCPEPVEGPFSLFLHPHHQSLPTQPFSLEVTVRRTPDTLHLRYRLTGRIEDLVIPPRTNASRADNLWQTTCFEAFIQSFGETAYWEFNFAPSTQWAAYVFAARREGMTDLAGSPQISVEQKRFELALTAQIEIPDTALHIGLSAVIEELNGIKSYWALTHPNPEKPDFHDPACFTLELSPPPGA